MSRKSRHVRKLTHRQPLPKRKGDRVILFAQLTKRIPHVVAGSMAFILIAVLFHHYLLRSDYFAVSQIEVSGTHRLTVAQVLNTIHARTGVGQGESIFLASESNLCKSLENIPEVATVTIRKEWPSSISVNIEEKQAVGIYATQTASYVYDSNGFLFARASANDFRKIHKAIFSAPASQSLTTEIPKAEFSLANNYLDVFAKASPVLAKAVSEIHFEQDSGLNVVLASGERFECGSRPPQETGPVIETLLATSTPATQITVANLVSASYATVARVTPPGATTERQIAKND